MTYTESRTLTKSTSFTCPDCGMSRFRVGRGKIACTNCDFVMGASSNKYGAKRTLAQDGVKRDSKYEAGVADELLLRKKLGDIKDYDSQFKVEMWAYDQNGKKAMKKTHKIDFRLHLNDGSYELLEAKGAETSDYRDRRRWLETFWLPFHPDHTYTVVKQNNQRRFK